MLPWSADLRGRIDQQTIASELLKDNPLKDPYERPLWVYLPPGYDAEPNRRYPSVYVIQGYTGHLAMWNNRAPFRQPFPETADAVFASGEAPPAIVVYVDAWTAYGGSQFVDSPGTGRYHSYLCDEVVPWVDARYRTLDGPGHRSIMGKSSGGFGAMITPVRGSNGSCTVPSWPAEKQAATPSSPSRSWSASLVNDVREPKSAHQRQMSPSYSRR